MGLMLSVLVVCVGVIEALSCFEHFQYGVIHCATNVYENARRRSSIFLKYTSKRLKLLSENSIYEFDEEPEVNVFQPVEFSYDSVTDFQSDDRPSEGESITIKKPKAIKLSSGPVKKLEKEDKIQIVKTLLERPRRPKTVRSISMPELMHTEQDVELTRIINDLAIEPIEEINIEIEDVNPDVLSREFDELFNEYENSPEDSGFKGSPLDDTEESTDDLELYEETKIVKPESVRYFESRRGENEIKNFQQNLKSDGLALKDEENDFIRTIPEKPVAGVIMMNISQRVSDKGAAFFEQALSKRGLTQNGGNSRIDRSTSVDFSKVKSITINKPVTADLDAFSETNNDSTEFIPDEYNSHNKFEDIIFQSDTPPVEVIDESFDEIYENLFDEPPDLTNTFQEIEKKVLGEIVSVEKEHKDRDEVPESVPEIQRNFLDEAPLASFGGKSISNVVFLKAIEQLAELLVRDSLNLSKIKDLLRENLNNFSENFYSSNNVSNRLYTPFESLPGSRTDILHISESRILKENVCSLKEGSDLENLIKSEERKASQITSDECFAEELAKTFLTEEENDITKVRFPVAEDYEETSDFVPFSEISNPPTVDLEVVRGESENRSVDKPEKEIPNLLLNQPTPSGNYSAIAEVLDDSIDSKLKVGKNVEKFSQSDGADFENRTRPSREDDRSGRAQEGFDSESQKNKTIDMINIETEVKLNIDEKGGLTPNKLEADFVKNQEKEPKGDVKSETDTQPYKGEELDLVESLQEEKPSRQLENAIIDTITQDATASRGEEADFTQKPPEKPSKQHKDAGSGSITQPDISPGVVDANIQIVESKPMLALVKGVDYEGNKEPTAVRDSIKKVEEVQSAEVVESTQSGEHVLKVHDRLKETAENVTFEQIGVVNSDLAEGKDALESDSTKERLHAKSVVLGFVEKEDEHSSESKNSSDVSEATSSAPEAFWLIFSGEYTKAMSKDWHSGHFSCWQCDEALTGQRYVLRDDHPYCIKCYESVFANVCEECNKIIGIDSKDLSYKDKHWHEACFLCNKCRVSLVDKQFGSKADKIYCGNCYDAQFASRCDGCGEIFRAGTKKMEYKTRQWHEKCFCCCVCKTPIGTKSFIPREQEIYCATCYEEKFATRCVKCNKIITSGGVTYKNEPWHRECFTCTNCNTSLAGQRFTSRDEKPYCAECFGELFAKRCTACSRPITGIGGTRFISFEDRHWHNDCFICASCKTSLVGRGFITDGDDIICPECAKQKLM